MYAIGGANLIGLLSGKFIVFEKFANVKMEKFALAEASARPSWPAHPQAFNYNRFWCEKVQFLCWPQTTSMRLRPVFIFLFLSVYIFSFFYHFLRLVMRKWQNAVVERWRSHGGFCRVLWPYGKCNSCTS